jgi:transcription elongation factor GreB
MVLAMAASGRRPEEEGRASNFITPEGIQRLQEEFDFLWRVERPKVTQAVSVAAAQGDRSENADYIYGKKRLREIDRRVRFLAKRIDDVVVVHASSGQPGKAFFGAWVTLEDEEGRRVRYRLVGPDEFDVSRGLISVDSPLGRALLGKQVDDEVTVERPRGRMEYTLLAVDYGSPGDS